MGYTYFDSPKGEDIDKKLLVTAKYAGVAGLFASTVDVMLFSYPKGYLQTLGRYAHFMGPFIATATAFTVTSNMLANIRKKDDRLNYFLGGVAAGSIVGAWRKNLMIGFVASVGFGILGIVKKDAIDEGWVFLPPLKVVRSGVHTESFDFTLTKERPRNWNTGE